MGRFTIILIAVFCWLQYALWFGKNGVQDYVKVNEAIEQQEKINEQLRERNGRLIAEISDLNRGLDAVEERARQELGMVKPHERYYRIVPEQSKADK